VTKNPTRLAAFAAVSVHDPEQAAEELTRCMTKKKGLVGVLTVLLSDFQSSGPGENMMLFSINKSMTHSGKLPIIRRAPVYLHPRIQ
jgi:2,3-dihydroxybenzoate decarboxylase